MEQLLLYFMSFQNIVEMYAGVQKDVVHAIKPFFLECETDHMAA